MTSAEMRPWVTEELEPSKKKRSLVDDLAYHFEKMWVQNDDKFRETATSTDTDDTVNGTVTIDKHILSYLIKQYAKHEEPNSPTAQADVAQINRVMYHVAHRFGKDRTAIAARKAEYLALMEAEPNGEIGEPSLNTRRPDYEGEPDSSEG